MSDALLADLARAAGVATHWTSHTGVDERVGADTLRAVLAALDLPAEGSAQIQGSLSEAGERSRATPTMLTVTLGQPVQLPVTGRVQFRHESGEAAEVDAGEGAPAWIAPRSGYWTLDHDGGAMQLAVAPAQCWNVRDAAPGRKPYGVAVQINALRGGGSAGFGDFAGLRGFVGEAARAGCDAVTLSPVHALFMADAGRFQPYSPSSRLVLNGLFADLSDFGVARSDDGIDGLIDWHDEGPRKRDNLARAFAGLAERPALRAAFDAFVREAEPTILGHARFEALDARYRREGVYHWRQWPDAFADARSATVAAMSAADCDVAFHLFVQWAAQRSLDAAQAEARGGGMGVGLIADLAVGMDPSGSHAWSAPDDVLHGLRIGAPPDPLGPDGQNWGLTALSPEGLRRSGFRGHLQTLRAALRGTGGVRIDHVMGMLRLWVVPDGAAATEGAYLSYPFEDLLRLTILESHRHRGIVIGEDLGTVPHGFRERLEAADILGMRVLWFERHGDSFIPPGHWSRRSVAMTTTHDLPTVRGWMAGSDIAWRERVGGEPNPAAHAERRDDAARLTTMFAAEGLISADIVEDAIAHVGSAASDLVIVAAEDIFALSEQPNLPGTVDMHPNWRRRLPPGASLGEEGPQRRLAHLAKTRRQP